ncbi:DUF5908 family protein [Enterobacter roggenkampii]|uniref:DUF5908 family protein n=1 Tax=Enterobacter roggenkampii TaxID=1812935 RepID=UPI002DBD8107|nr:DUF5908 family protein [Enterobacter roggenkampii]MEB5889997.1 DUF5908 family protein [Enterobacter roggenkampii]
MTIEIDELVIQASVTPGQGAHPAEKLSQSAQREDDERWVELVSERVMQQLRDMGGWPL